MLCLVNMVMIVAAGGTCHLISSDTGLKNTISTIFTNIYLWDARGGGKRERSFKTGVEMKDKDH